MGSIFRYFKKNEIALNGKVYNFPINYGLIDVNDILHVHNTKCKSLNNQPCLCSTALIDLDSVELHY